MKRRRSVSSVAALAANAQAEALLARRTSGGPPGGLRIFCGGVEESTSMKELGDLEGRRRWPRRAWRPQWSAPESVAKQTELATRKQKMEMASTMGAGVDPCRSGRRRPRKHGRCEWLGVGAGEQLGYPINPHVKTLLDNTTLVGQING